MIARHPPRRRCLACMSTNKQPPTVHREGLRSQQIAGVSSVKMEHPVPGNGSDLFAGYGNSWATGKWPNGAQPKDTVFAPTQNARLGELLMLLGCGDENRAHLTRARLGRKRAS